MLRSNLTLRHRLKFLTIFPLEVQRYQCSPRLFQQVPSNALQDPILTPSKQVNWLFLEAFVVIEDM